MIVLNDCMIEDKFLSTAQNLQKLTFFSQYEPAVMKKDVYKWNQF